MREHGTAAPPELRDLVVGALEGAADCIECDGPRALAGIVPGWLIDRLDDAISRRFARAARELAGQIEAGLWDHSLARCTADELLVHRCIDEAGWSWELEHPERHVDIEAARDEVLMDEDVLLFWMPDAERIFARDPAALVLDDGPSAEPARWFDRFTTTGRDRPDP